MKKTITDFLKCEQFSIARNRLTVLLLFSCFKILAQRSCEIKSRPFVSGETMIYDVYYHWGLIWAHAGECTFSVKKEEFANTQTLHFVGEGHTINSYDHFFKVRDRFDSWTDTSSLAPYRYIRNSHEGSTKTYNDNYFDHKKRSIICYKVIGKKSEVKKDTVKYEDCTFDVLSMIYYARCINYSNYKKNDKIPISLYLDGSVNDSLYIRYIGKEKIKTRSGVKSCIVFSPLLLKGTIFAGGENMTVWVTDDDKKMPLLIKSSIVVGEIQVKMREGKN